MDIGLHAREEDVGLVSCVSGLQATGRHWFKHKHMYAADVEGKRGRQAAAAVASSEDGENCRTVEP